MSAAHDWLWAAINAVTARVEAGGGSDAALPVAPSTPLAVLAERFSLTPFETQTIVLCVGVEIDPDLVQKCGSGPTFGLALDVLPRPHWSALAPAGPLRRWMLIEMDRGASLLTAPIRIAERVLHFLLGEEYLDGQLTTFFEPIPRPDPELIAPTHRRLAERIAEAWLAPEMPPAVQLIGGSVPDVRAVVATACATVGVPLWSVATEILPSSPVELDAVMRLWRRDSFLAPAALLVESFDGPASDPARASLVTRAIEMHGGLVIFSGGSAPRRRSVVTFDVGPPPYQERKVWWEAALSARGIDGAVAAPGLASQFALGAADIETAVAIAEADAHPEHLVERAWDVCRSRGRGKLEEFARRIEPSATFADLVLPKEMLATLRSIVLAQRERAQVIEEWGFGGASARGLGLSVLFAGPSGTGKTLAAEALATELRLDLYVIDVSAIVNKYVGETEKNLRRIFDAAEEGGSVLLFDEADALFGRRGEVQDSHDRFANMEVGYLLQRMESYRGIAILTTNLRGAIDDAFLRRLRFVVDFPFPAPELRVEMWRRAFPPSVPLEGLDYTRLARLNIAGGAIRNIALVASFAAAAEKGAVTMRQILDAAQAEYAKSMKSPTAAELGESTMR